MKKRNLLVRLNLSDNGNIIDAVDMDGTQSSLEQNYPNPFIGRTEISYELAESNDVVVEISDITGKVIDRHDEGFKPAGNHNVTINADKYEAGIYFYTLKAGDFVQTKRMVVK